MGQRQRGGYSQRRGLKTKRIMTDVGISVKYKLERIAEARGESKSGTLNNILRDALSEYELDSLKEVGRENAEKNAFIEAFMKEHFGDDPEDETAAMAEALNAYHQKVGLRFASEEETFILPE